MTMCRVLELEKILDFNYTTKIGLSVYVKFSLSKWLGTRQKLFKSYTKALKTREQSNAWPKVLPLFLSLHHFNSKYYEIIRVT